MSELQEGAREKAEANWEAVAIIQARGDGDSGDEEKWMDLECVLEVEPRGLTNGCR